MDWNFPTPEEDPKYQKDYDAMFGRGSFERDFLQKKRQQESKTVDSRTSANLPEYKLNRNFYWDYDKSVGVVQINGKFVGVACLSAKEITNAENYIRKFGLDFKRDVQWKAISELLGHLSRNPMFKAVLITSSRIPLQLQPDIPEELRGRMNWANRNYQYHKDALYVLNHDVKAAREFGTFPVPKKLLDRENQESLNAVRFLNEQRALESQAESHLKPYHQIKDKLFTACLLFYIYTSEYNNYEQALQEIIRRRYATKMEIIKSYFINCVDVNDPEIVFTGFVPKDELLRTYGGVALSEDAAGFSSDKDVAIALRKMFTTALELPKEEVVIEEKIHIPTEEVSVEGPRKIFIGYIVESVVKRKVSRRKVMFPLDILTSHGLVLGASGSGKTWFLMSLAKKLAEYVKVTVIDPHGTFNLLRINNPNITVFKPQNADEVVKILTNIYNEALSQPIQNQPELKHILIIDEISASNLSSGIKKIMKLVDSIYSETRKFGYGCIVAAQYAVEARAVSNVVRENARTYFIFSKKTLTELERLKTLKHPSMNLLPYLAVGFMAIVSEDFHAEPFFVKVPSVASLLRNMKVQSNHNQIPSATITTMSNTDTPEVQKTPSHHNNSSNHNANHDEKQAICKKCGYSWVPRKDMQWIKECPTCKTREWR